MGGLDDNTRCVRANKNNWKERDDEDQWENLLFSTIPWGRRTSSSVRRRAKMGYLEYDEDDEGFAGHGFI